VLHLPPAEQRFPGLIVITVRRDPRVLRIPWTCIVPINGGAHEALTIIGGGVKKVPDDLEARPAARAPRNAGQRRVKSE